MDRPLREDRPRSSSGLRTLVVFGAALTALLVVVAVASQRTVAPAGRGSEPTGQLVPTVVYDVVFTLFLFCGLLIIPIAAWSYARETKGVLAGKPRIRILPFVMIAAFFAILVVFSLGDEFAAIVERLRFVGSGSGDGERRATEYQPSFEWIAVAIASALLVLVGGTFAASRVLSGRGRRVADGEFAEVMSRALDETLEDIEGESDPRRAIILAYARMEAVLDCCGLPRRESEAPLEYLSRVLLELEVRPEPVAALTDLFELAKFSHHALEPPKKQEAIAALQAIREDLRELA